MQVHLQGRYFHNRVLGCVKTKGILRFLGNGSIAHFCMDITSARFAAKCYVMKVVQELGAQGACAHPEKFWFVHRSFDIFIQY